MAAPFDPVSTDRPERTDVRVRLDFTDDYQVRLWARDRMPVAYLVKLLRDIADQFETGDAHRIA